MYHSGLFHRRMPAYRAAAYVNIPCGFEQLHSGHAGIPLFKALSVLDSENELEIFCFHAVAQKTVIAYFLKAGGKHMHKITPDEFRIV